MGAQPAEQVGDRNVLLGSPRDGGAGGSGSHHVRVHTPGSGSPLGPPGTQNNVRASWADGGWRGAGSCTRSPLHKAMEPVAMLLTRTFKDFSFYFF